MHGYVDNLLYIEEHGFKVRTLNAILDAFHEYVCVFVCFGGGGGAGEVFLSELYMWGT